MLLSEYLDRARANHGLRSDRELGRLLGFQGAAISQWRSKRSWPTEENMVRLADLAGVERQQAIIELAMWRAASPEVRSTYEAIRDALAKTGSLVAVAAIFIGSLLTAPHADALERDGNRLTPVPHNCTLSDN